MLNKRAAAEQLRKYATVARLIREQREIQKRAWNQAVKQNAPEVQPTPVPAQTVKRPLRPTSWYSHHKQYWQELPENPTLLDRFYHWWQKDRNPVQAPEQ